MRKLKIPVLILITIALLIVGATLPAIASALQDQAVVNRSGFGEMESLKLDFSDPEVAPVTPLLQKLALLRDGSFYTVSPSKTKIAQSDIEQVVRDGLDPYYEAELIPYNWGNYEFSALPHLVYSKVDVDAYAIFWVVSIYWLDSEEYLDLYVDADTGNILYLHFSSYKTLEAYTAYGYLGMLSSTYLNATGLMEIMNDPGSWAVKDVTCDTSGLNAQNDPWIAYRIIHPEYGELEIQFWLYQNGFYTAIH